MTLSMPGTNSPMGAESKPFSTGTEMTVVDHINKIALQDSIRASTVSLELISMKGPALFADILKSNEDFKAYCQFQEARQNKTIIAPKTPLDSYTEDQIDRIAEFHWVAGTRDKSKKKQMLWDLLINWFNNDGLYLDGYEANKEACEEWFNNVKEVKSGYRPMQNNIMNLSRSDITWPKCTAEQKANSLKYLLVCTDSYDKLEAVHAGLGG